MVAALLIDRPTQVKPTSTHLTLQGLDASGTEEGDTCRFPPSLILSWTILFLQIHIALAQTEHSAQTHR